MQRVSGANYLANGAGAGKNAYQDYNAATGQPGTTPNAAALTAMQEEIASLIEWGGLALNPADNTQLRQAIVAYIASQTATLETSAAATTALATAVSGLDSPAQVAAAIAAALTAYAPLASPALTGAPTAPSPANGDNSTKIATTGWVRQQGHNYSGSGIGIPGNLTLALGNLGGWGQFQAAGVTATLPPVASVVSGQTFTFLGSSTGGTIKGNAAELILSASNAAANTLSIGANEEVTLSANGTNWFVVSDGISSAAVAAQYAPLASPNFTGTPTAPTLANTDNSTKLASTAFVQSLVASALSPYETAAAATSSLASAVAGLDSPAQVASAISAALTAYAPLASPALTGAPTAPTPAVSDSSTKLATTAFVRSMGSAFSGGGLGLNTSTSITAAQLGGWGQIQGVGLTITLPSLASTIIGQTFTLLGAGSGGTLKGNGTDSIVPSNGGAANTLAVAACEIVTVVSNGASGWFVAEDGVSAAQIAAQYAALASFTNSLGTSGYQKLPGGLIMQWCQVACTAGGAAAFTWPIAFPTAVYLAVPGGMAGLTFSGSYSAYLSGVTTSGGTAYGNNGSSSSSTVSIIAIGK